MAGGPIFPCSAFPVTAGRVFPTVYVGGGANSKQDVGLGVQASVGADSIWRLRFQIPTTLPSGTPKLRMLALANATSGAAKVTPACANVAAGASPSAATLVNETQVTMTWAAGDNDKYKESKVALTTVPTAGSMFVIDVTFNTTSWTLAQVSCWFVSIVWE
jgi:hypothetical protein